MGAQLATDLAKNGTHGVAVDTFLRLDAVKAATGLGRSTIYEKISEGTFPKPVKLLGEGSKAVGWVGSEIAEWQRQRIAARDAIAA